MTREEAARVLTELADDFEKHELSENGWLETTYIPAHRMGAAALRGPQPDPTTGLVPCGCGCIVLPREMVEYIKRHACNVQVNVCHTDVVNGYGSRITASVTVSEYAEWCNRSRCQYHSITNPSGECQGAQRHNLSKGYVDVFKWADTNGDKLGTLRDAWNRAMGWKGGAE